MPPITNNLDNNEIALDREVLVPCGQPPHVGLACFIRQENAFGCSSGDGADKQIGWK